MACRQCLALGRKASTRQIHQRLASSDANSRKEPVASTSKLPNKYKPTVLPRPIGVSVRTVDSRTAQEVKQDQNKDKRKVLVKELQKSYFQDFKEIQENAGKLWIAPETAIRADKALLFPEMHGRTLLAKDQISTSSLLPGKVSLVAIEGTRLSMDHIQSFIETVAADQANEPNFQLVRINLQENYLKSLLVNMFLSSLRTQIPQEQHANYLVASQNIEMLREPMGMLNKTCGYCYLVDWKSRIRWASVGFAQPQELLGLRTITSVLLERQKSNKEG